MSRDLTQYEYEALVARITEIYKDKEGIGGGYDSTTGQMLIELLADSVDALAFMLERRTQETYLETARLKSSIWALASSVGYIPRRMVGATGTLELVLLDSNGNPTSAAGTINIPYGTRTTLDGREFIVAEDAQLLPGDSSTTIPIVQGKSRTQTYNFNLEPYYSDNFIVLGDYEKIEEFSLKVFNGDDQFFFVDEPSDDGYRLGALSFASPDDAGYDIKFGFEGMRIIFGDGKFGKRPEGNVVVTWTDTEGDDVAVVNTGLEFAFENDILYDDLVVTPPNQYKYILTNNSTISGGQDAEHADSIRQSVAEYVRTNDRAVTNFDYEFRVRRSGIGGIKDVSVYGENEQNTIIFTMNNVYVAYVRQDGFELNVAQQQQLRDYIDRYKVNTTHIVLRPAIETPLRLNIDFKRHRLLPISDAQLYRDVRKAVYEYFAVGKGTIGKEFQHSEFVEFLQNLTTEFNGVRYKMTDFVYVAANAFFPFKVPTPAYDGIIELSYDYTIQRDDIWNVAVDGVTFSERVRASDSIETLVLRMREQIFTNTSLMVATPAPNQIRVSHPLDTGTYEISVGSGDLVEFTRFRQLLQLPLSGESITGIGTQIKRGTATIYDSNDTPIMSDVDGNGLIESLDGYFFPDVLIDYQKALMELPSVPNGTYYVQWQQNDFQNFKAAQDGYIGISDIRTYEQLNSPDVFFSNIRLLP